MKNAIKSIITLLGVCFISWLVSYLFIYIGSFNDFIGRLLEVAYLLCCTPVSVYLYEEMCSKDKISIVLGGIIVLIYNAFTPVLYAISFLTAYFQNFDIGNFLFNFLSDPLLYFSIAIIISIILSIGMIKDAYKGKELLF